MISFLIVTLSFGTIIIFFTSITFSTTTTYWHYLLLPPYLSEIIFYPSPILLPSPFYHLFVSLFAIFFVATISTFCYFLPCCHFLLLCFIDYSFFNYYSLLCVLNIFVSSSLSTPIISILTIYTLTSSIILRFHIIYYQNLFSYQSSMQEEEVLLW